MCERSLFYEKVFLHLSPHSHVAVLNISIDVNIHTRVYVTYKALYAGIDILTWCTYAYVYKPLRFMSWSSLIHFKAANEFSEAFSLPFCFFLPPSSAVERRGKRLRRWIRVGILIYDTSGYKYICDVEHTVVEAKKTVLMLPEMLFHSAQVLPQSPQPHRGIAA